MRRRKERRHAEELGEPEILPMMNVLFMLVMVLMGMSAFLPLGVVTTEAPKLSSGKASAVSGKKSQWDLRVMLLKSGINISVNGHPMSGRGRPFIPKEKSGNERVYNFAKLQAELAKLKIKHPSRTSIMIMSDPDVIYDDIIHTMDAARESADGKLLFPGVQFIPGVIR